MKRRLKQNAQPSIFVNMPSYFVPQDKPLRSDSATSSARHRNVAERIHEQNQNFLLADAIKSSDELISRLPDEAQRFGYVLQHLSEGVCLIYLSK